MTSGSDSRDVEEELRRAAAEGDEEAVTSFISRGTNVNSQNSVNGWTALHWACKRGHRKIVAILLMAGADSALTSVTGETCVSVTSDPLIRKQLGVDACEPDGAVSHGLPIVPNYIRHPTFPYANASAQEGLGWTTKSNIPQSNSLTRQEPRETVLKVRVANSSEKDFIEIDLPRDSLTYDRLVSLMCAELEVGKSQIQKVRKLPDTIVRRDRDVQRLRDYQELELVLAGSHPAPAANFQNYKASVAPKHFDVFY